MRRFVLLSLLLAAVPAFAGPTTGIPPAGPTAAPTFSSAIDYNDYIVTAQTDIGNKILAFSGTMNGSDVPSMDRAQTALVDQVGQSLARVKAMKGYDGSTALRDAAIALFEFYARVSANEYKQLLDMVRDDEMTEDEKVRAEAIITAISADEAKYDAAFQVAQESFAIKYGFPLEANELQQKFDQGTP